MSLLRRLNTIAKKMSELKSLYKAYPADAKDLGKWRKKVESIYREVKQLTSPQTK
jgi:DNA repair ATPase RecN